MAITVREVARQMVAQMGLEGGPELAAQWVGQRYSELCSRAKFRHLRQFGQLYLRAPLLTGSVTLTLDSELVVADPTALADWQSNEFYQFPDGFTGLWFRPQIGTSWYRIKSCDNSGNIYLETPYAQDNGYLLSNGTVQSDVSFYILPRFIDLDPTARQLGVFMCDFLFRPLTLVSEDDLNRRVPNRFLVSTYPQFVAELNNNADVTGMPKTVEIYPWPQQSVTVHYTYWQTPTILTWDDYLPPTIDPDVLRTGASIDAAAHKAGRALRMGQLQEAQMWRSIKAEEEMMWERKISRAVRNDRGADDIKFVMRNTSWKRPLDWDPITDSYQNFLARGY